HERLVEQKHIGLDREGARQRHPPGESERKLPGLVIAMGLEAKRLEQRGEPGGGGVRCGKPHVLLNRSAPPPPRLLADPADPAASAKMPCRTRGVVKRGELSVPKLPVQTRAIATAVGLDNPAGRVEPPAPGGLKTLLIIVFRKPVSGVSGSHLFHTAAPST